ncbi:hypothetical protein DSECCO2_541270 [anaerobic digester metagenome]
MIPFISVGFNMNMLKLYETLPRDGDDCGSFVKNCRSRLLVSKKRGHSGKFRCTVPFGIIGPGARRRPTKTFSR